MMRPGVNCAAFCKGSSKKSCGAGGFVCKGHFVGAKVRFASITALHLAEGAGGQAPYTYKVNHRIQGASPALADLLL